MFEIVLGTILGLCIGAICGVIAMAIASVASIEDDKIEDDMATFPKEEKPLGYSVKCQQGDWLVTFEVVGYNDRAQCNIWAEKHRKWNPRPSFADAIAAMDAEKQHQYTKDLHKHLKEQDLL